MVDEMKSYHLIYHLISFFQIIDLTSYCSKDEMMNCDYKIPIKEEKVWGDDRSWDGRWWDGGWNEILNNLPSFLFFISLHIYFSFLSFKHRFKFILLIFISVSQSTMSSHNLPSHHLSHHLPSHLLCLTIYDLINLPSHHCRGLKIQIIKTEQIMMRWGDERW